MKLLHFVRAEKCSGAFLSLIFEIQEEENGNFSVTLYFFILWLFLFTEKRHKEHFCDLLLYMDQSP